MLRYIPPLPDTISLEEPELDDEGEKSDRGWDHLRTGRMLCPLDQLEDFDADPKG